MKLISPKSTLTLILWIISGLVHAEQSATGIWATEKTSEGYLHVTIEPCANALCGTITTAYHPDNSTADDYEHLGKKMVWDMLPKAQHRWSGGKIWDPTNDKTYKSKMLVKGDKLSVSGCVLLFCKSQIWTRVSGESE